MGFKWEQVRHNLVNTIILFVHGCPKGVHYLRTVDPLTWAEVNREAEDEEEAAKCWVLSSWSRVCFLHPSVLQRWFLPHIACFFFAKIQTTKRYAQELSEVFCFFLFLNFWDQLHLIIPLHASSLILYAMSFLDVFHRYLSPIIMICDVTSTSDVVKAQFREFINTDPSVPPAASIVWPQSRSVHFEKIFPYGVSDYTLLNKRPLMNYFFHLIPTVVFFL